MALELPYESWGRTDRTAPALFLLHGFTGNRSAWRHLEPLLGPHHRVFAADLPGHGGAPLPTRTGFEAFEETLDALQAILHREAPGGASILGYSQGARMALGLALRPAVKVQKLVLESVSPGLRWPKERRNRQMDDEALAQRLETDGLSAFMDFWEALPMFAGLRALPEPERQALRRRREGSSPEGLAGALRRVGVACQPSYWERLSALRVPTLLLTGAEDKKFTDIARQAQRDIPTAYHRAFEGCHHAPHLEAKDAYAAEVLAFVRTPVSDDDRDDQMMGSEDE
jgi:2-succinyl-6-hydroxy-2,4-cyclohexadiene-1-carboxylate synthase